MAATGHKSQIVTSATQEHIDALAEMPLQKGSLFEALMFTLTTDGLDGRLRLPHSDKLQDHSPSGRELFSRP